MKDIRRFFKSCDIKVVKHRFCDLRFRYYIQSNPLYNYIRWSDYPLYFWRKNENYTHSSNHLEANLLTRNAQKILDEIILSISLKPHMSYAEVLKDVKCRQVKSLKTFKAEFDEQWSSEIAKEFRNFKKYEL